jgi:uncharacterized protein YndB with AHSA1/START domain
MAEHKMGISDLKISFDGKVIYDPLPQQRKFHMSPAKYRLLGGAVGGGKSMALMAEAIMRSVKYDFPLTGAIFRRSFPELESTIIRGMLNILPNWFYKYNQAQHVMTLKNGSIIEFCYAESDADVIRYQSREWDWLAIDEVTHFCLVPETEVLTKNGWKKITDIEGEVVMTLSQEERLEWKEVIGLNEFDYDGDMKLVNQRCGISFCSTPNHKQVVERKDGWEYVRTDMLPGSVLLKRGGLWNGKRVDRKYFKHEYKGHNEVESVDMKDWCEFLGWYLSEGYSFCSRGDKSPVVGIRQMKRVLSVEHLLDRLGWRWKYNKDGKYEIFSRQLYEEVHPLGNTYTKYVPGEIKELDTDYLLRFFYAFMLGDGHLDPRLGKKSYSTGLANEQLIDDLQEICLKVGFVATKGYQKVQERFDIWRLSITKRKKESCQVNKREILDVPYKGKVYCPTVKDNHNFVMRYNGRVMITGNSEYQFTYLGTRVRTVKPINTKIFAGTNPGGRGHCVPYGDVLTPGGWKPIQEIRVGEEVLTLGEDNLLKYVKVDQTIKEQYKGKLYRSNTKNADFVCTPEHKIVRITETKNKNGRRFHEPSLVKVKDLPSVTRLPKVGEWESESPEFFILNNVEHRKLKHEQPLKLDFDDYCEFMGWFLSEGCTVKGQSRVVISQNKPKEREIIRNLLDRIGFHYYENDENFMFYSPAWHSYLREFGNCREKYVPREILNSSKNSLEVFYRAIMLGDGDKNGRYYTLSERLANDMEEVGIKIGLRARKTQRLRKNRNYVCYQIQFKQNILGWLERDNITEEDYNGEVYCLGIKDLHRFYLRQNGTVFLSGNSFVKERWITKTCDQENYNPKDYDFISAGIYDNPYLMNNNPDYLENLKMLPEKERKALLEGNWDVFEGLFFSDWSTTDHVVDDFDVPESWQLIMGWDDGSREPRAVYVAAIDNDQRVWVIWEYYMAGENLTQAAEKIRAQLKENGYWSRIYKCVVDPSMKRVDSQTGISSVEVLESMGFGFKIGMIELGNNSRVEGWRVMKSYLAHKPYEEPLLKVFRSCINIIRTVPQLIYYQPRSGASSKKEDLDTTQEDHSADALRYLLMSLDRLPSRFESSSSYVVKKRNYSPKSIY